MDKEIIVRLHSDFERMVRTHADSGVEYWCARELQMLLGYNQWRTFAAVIDKAITSCENAGYDPKDHFARARKMVDLGSGAKREIEDLARFVVRSPEPVVRASPATPVAGSAVRCLSPRVVTDSLTRKALLTPSFCPKCSVPTPVTNPSVLWIGKPVRDVRQLIERNRSKMLQRFPRLQHLRITRLAVGTEPGHGHSAEPLNLLRQRLDNKKARRLLRLTQDMDTLQQDFRGLRGWHHWRDSLSEIRWIPLSK